MDVCLLCLYGVLFCVGSGLYDGLITRSEKSYSVSNCMCDHRNPERGPMFQVGNLKENERMNDNDRLCECKGRIVGSLEVSPLIFVEKKLCH
jgi:hypothetical protein